MRMPPRVLLAAALSFALLPAAPASATVPPQRGVQVGQRVAPSKVTKITLRVDAATGRHPISPLIYGVNFADQVPGLAQRFTVPIGRWGGNSTSRYNYTNHTYNTGADWYYENVVAHSGDSLEPVEDFVSANQAAGTASLVTVPMLGWVSKDSPSEHPFTC